MTETREESDKTLYFLAPKKIQSGCGGIMMKYAVLDTDFISKTHHEARSADVSAKDVNAGEKASPGQEAQKLEKKQSAMPPGKRKRRSVLKRLREKQAEIAARSGQSAPDVIFPGFHDSHGGFLDGFRCQERDIDMLFQPGITKTLCRSDKVCGVNLIRIEMRGVIAVLRFCGMDARGMM